MTAATNKQPKAKILGTIAHYRIVRKIGAGGMSMVYEAFDQKLQRSVALKILHPGLAQSEEYRIRFFREAQAVAQLSHPNIVQIFDVCAKTQDLEQLYIATELVRGETLKDFAKKINFKEIPELAAMIIWQVSQALEHAHQKGIIHRDLKPENIMICDDGHTKLMDFGIARMSNQESFTQTGTLLGSLAHVSPEIIKGSQATSLSDIFSLTTVYYWLLSGTLPFEYKTPHALLKSIVEEPAPPILDLVPHLSDQLAEIIYVGMNKNPKKRFKNAQSMAQAIENSLKFFGLQPDEKKIRKLLIQAKKNFSNTQQIIYSLIKTQAQKYQKDKLETQALILNCRLGNIDSTQKFSHKKNNFTFKKMLILACVLLICIAGLLRIKIFHRVQKYPQKFSEQKIYYESAFLADQEITPIGKKINPPKLIFHKKQEINFIIWPFANIFLNEKLHAQDQENFKIKLTTGTYKFLFTHDYAVSVEKVIKIDKIGAPQIFKIMLDKTKASKLIIHTNIEADIAIDGKYRGTTKRSSQTPIIIPMPDKTHAQTHEIMIQKENYRPYIINFEFIAGKTHHIKINLLRSTETKTLIDQPMHPSLKRLYI